MTKATRPWATRLDNVGARLVGALPVLLAVTLVLLAAWRLAIWFWVLVPAPATTAAPLRTVEGGSAAVARHWFGEAVLATVPPAAGSAPMPAAPAASEFRLLGVISGGRRPAAMIAVGKTTHDALVGETFADGVRLQAVAADHVLLEKQGRTFRVELPVAAGAPAPTGTVGGLAGPGVGLAPTASHPSTPGAARAPAATISPPAVEPGVPVHNPMRRPETAARKP